MEKQKEISKTDLERAFNYSRGLFPKLLETFDGIKAMIQLTEKIAFLMANKPYSKINRWMDGYESGGDLGFIATSILSMDRSVKGLAAINVEMEADWEVIVNEEEIFNVKGDPNLSLYLVAQVESIREFGKLIIQESDSMIECKDEYASLSFLSKAFEYPNLKVPSIYMPLIKAENYPLLLLFECLVSLIKGKGYTRVNLDRNLNMQFCELHDLYESQLIASGLAYHEIVSMYYDPDASKYDELRSKVPVDFVTQFIYLLEESKDLGLEVDLDGEYPRIKSY